MNRPRILVGMSGGVDSSVSAALLLEQGHDVEGVFLKVWSDDDVTDLLVDCPWEADLADARAVADQLGIKFHVRNVQREYFERVVARMKAGYAAGETPNPDVLCNSEIKFGLLYDWAMAEGYDAVATGHYAQVVKSEKNPKSEIQNNNAELHTAVDSFKDQTYFLWRIPREKLGHILFPIGHLQKLEVRALASHFSLPTATKPDSQGICFLGRVNVHDWLRRELRTQPGPVITRDGRRVGTHAGAALATIGQRHTIGIAGGGPVLYVVEKNLTMNTLVVAPKSAVMGRDFRLVNSNWLVDDPLSYPAIEARIRHQGERIPVSSIGESHDVSDDRQTTMYELRLASPAFAIAPGQSVVLYSGETVIGGGMIAQMISNAQ